MPLSLPIGTIKPYNQQIATFRPPSRVKPGEGPLIAPIELLWDGVQVGFQITLQGRTTNPFSQIVMLDVDNSQCGADVDFLFFDTGDTLLVPAYTAGTFPVFTNALSFYAVLPNPLVPSLATDVTRIRVLNFADEPITTPQPAIHAAASPGLIVATASSTTPILASTVSGTLVGYSAFLGIVPGAGAGNAVVQLYDHTLGQSIDLAQAVYPSGGIAVNTPLFSGVGGNFAYRFKGGIDIVLTVNGTAPVQGALTCSIKYRSP